MRRCHSYVLLEKYAYFSLTQHKDWNQSETASLALAVAIHLRDSYESGINHFIQLTGAFVQYLKSDFR